MRWVFLLFLGGCSVSESTDLDATSDGGSLDAAPVDAEPRDDCTFGQRSIPYGAGFADGCNLCQCTERATCTAAYCESSPQCTAHADCPGGACAFDRGCGAPVGFCCFVAYCADATGFSLGNAVDSTHCRCDGTTSAGAPSQPYEHMGACAGATLGAACTSSSDCSSGYCADGVCCENACDAHCESCSAAGACEPIVDGQDPGDECEQSCNGARSCTAVELCSESFPRSALLAIDPSGALIAASEGDDLTLSHRGADCAAVWSRTFVGSGIERVFALAVDEGGGILISGTFQRSVSFGGADLTARDDRTSGFLARLDSDGAHVFSFAFGSAGVGLRSIEPLDLEVDTSSNALLVGSFRDDVNFGGPTLSAEEPTGFAAKLSPGGAHVFTLALDAEVTAVGIDAANEIVVATDRSLVRLDPAGNTIWSRPLNLPHGAVVDLEIDPAGEVVLGGNIDGRMDFGGAVLESEGGGDIFLAKLTSSGDLLWQQRYGDTSHQILVALDLDAAGRIGITGHFNRTIELDVKYRSIGGGDVFTAVLGPDGSVVFSHIFTGDVSESPFSLAFDGNDLFLTEGVYDAVLLKKLAID